MVRNDRGEHISSEVNMGDISGENRGTGKPSMETSGISSPSDEESKGQYALHFLKASWRTW